MPEEEKKFYPMLATRSWWLLRKKFKQSIPAKVDSLYCKKVLGGSEKSATGNVIPYLKDIGLIDEEGNTQQAFATRWRNDSEYEKICEEIKKKIYSTDLLDKIQDPASERKDTVEWFMSKTRVGEGTFREQGDIRKG